MTNERVCANGQTMSRRTLLTAIPASGVALTVTSDSPVSAETSDYLLGYEAGQIEIMTQIQKIVEAKQAEKARQHTQTSLATIFDEWLSERQKLNQIPANREADFNLQFQKVSKIGDRIEHSVARSSSDMLIKIAVITDFGGFVLPEEVFGEISSVLGFAYDPRATHRGW